MAFLRVGDALRDHADGRAIRAKGIATLSAARYNASIRTFYQRLKEDGKPDKVARTAATRGLLLIAHAIYKSDQPFRGAEEAGT